MKSTFGSNSLLHWGLMKYIIPFKAPSSVADLISKMNKIMYGNIAKKYEAFPELLTPLINVNEMQIHANTKHKTNSQFGVPIPSSIESFSFRMSLLKREYLIDDLRLFSFNDHTHLD